ncbi:MAG TPA: T9SS type A sorting domain-containing protein [Rubricoccaceae bacterium]|nr:T9SS type A sorting domain-containing protein [Rubricoccaceae bacterium]
MTRFATSLFFSPAGRLLLLFPAVWLVGLPAARAQVTSVVSGTELTIFGDAGNDAITVTSEGGLVKINGQDPTTGPFPSNQLTFIRAEGGDGNDDINLSAVTPAHFGNVATVEVAGEGGNDDIVGSSLDDETFHYPGDGADTVDLGEGEGDQGYVTGSPAQDFWIVHPIPGPGGGYVLEVDAGPGDLVHFTHAGAGGTVSGNTEAGNDRVDIEMLGGLFSILLEGVELDGDDGQDEVFVTPPLQPGEVEVREPEPLSFEWAMRLISGGGGIPPEAQVGGGGPVFLGRNFETLRSLYAGVFRIVPLVDVAQNHTGISSADTLVVDVLGLPYTQSGNQILVQGRAPITHNGYEVVLFVSWTAAEEQPTSSGSALSAAFPNPFSTSAAITLAVARPQRVRVALYDLLGREVAVLHDGLLPAGEQTFEVSGAGLPSGVYVVRAEGEAFTAARRVALVR